MTSISSGGSTSVSLDIIRNTTAGVAIPAGQAVYLPLDDVSLANNHFTWIDRATVQDSSLYPDKSGVYLVILQLWLTVTVSGTFECRLTTGATGVGLYGDTRVLPVMTDNTVAFEMSSIVTILGGEDSIHVIVNSLDTGVANLSNATDIELDIVRLGNIG